MNKYFGMVLTVATVALTIQYKSEKAAAGYLENPCRSVLSCLPSCKQKSSSWFLNGHAEAGFYANQYGQKSSYYPNGGGFDWDSGNTGFLQNARLTGLQLNQGYLSFGKSLDTRCGWDIGGQVDFVFGSDAYMTQSHGLDDNWNTGDYYTSLPQLFTEFGYRNVSVKVGKFYTPFGYEVFKSPDRFFYSLSDSFGLQPVTHSGVLVDWNVTNQLTLIGGWVNGQGRFFDGEDNAFLGGISYDFSKRFNAAYTFMVGKDDSTRSDYFINTLVTTYALTSKLDYVFEWTLNDADNSSTLYAINNELLYRHNSKWAYGLRAEWANVGDDTVGLTFGANWTPTDWFLLRPELRYDSFSNWEAFNGSKSNWTDAQRSQFAGGFSAVVKF